MGLGVGAGLLISFATKVGLFYYAAIVIAAIGGFISIYEFNNTSRRYRSSHGIDEKEWAPIEIEGLSKSIIQKNGLIILTLKK